MDHWKLGDGFAIRYGGYRDIEWFHGNEFRVVGGIVTVPPLHPAALAIEAAKAVGLVLQWWELRKQTQLLAAEFEERRLLWVADMLAGWAEDISKAATLRLDSTRYLERELGRLMTALMKTPRMDVPAVLLLQLERASIALVDLNTLVHAELSRRIGDLSDADRDAASVPEYRAFNAVRELVPFESKPDGFFQEVRKRLPQPFGPEADPFAQYLKHAKRRSDFHAVETLMVELRSGIELIEAARQFPPTLRTYSEKEVRSGEEGTVITLPKAER